MNNVPLTPATGEPTETLVQYILRITFEIWEQRGIERIHDYYAEDTPVYALAGVTHGAQVVVDGTRAMLDAFPDRILVGDDVVCSGDVRRGYSSHRIISTMTHRGAGPLGAPTGRQARILTIADCVVEDGRIVREWLFRDQFSLVRQLGLDPIAVARGVRAGQSAETRAWLAGELDRLNASSAVYDASEHEHGAWCAALLSALWMGVEPKTIEPYYAPYVALHAAGDHLLSGRDELLLRYAGLSAAFAVDRFEVEHVASPPATGDDQCLAVRWSAAAEHVGEFEGVAPTGRRVLIAGATHWRRHAGVVITEWTVFDTLGVLAQIVDPA
ncbi:MAG: ester cyclase [Pseudomonadota bacterium]